jgi:hypothetical protein
LPGDHMDCCDRLGIFDSSFTYFYGHHPSSSSLFECNDVIEKCRLTPGLGVLSKGP